MCEDTRNASIHTNFKKLVTCIVGADVSASEARTCEQQALHKFRQHRCISTNSHEVRRFIDKVAERFHCEGMADQADALRELTNVILEHPYWNDHDVVDIKYAMLDFLFSVAYAPIQNVRRDRFAMNRRLQEIKDALRVPNVGNIPNAEINSEDWVAMLREDFIEMPDQSSDSESDLSDWSDDDQNEELQLKTGELECKTSLDQREMALIYARAKNYPNNPSTFVSSSNGIPSTSNRNFEINQPTSLNFQHRLGDVSRWNLTPKTKPLTPPQAIRQYTILKIDPNYLETKYHMHQWRQHMSINTQMLTNDPYSNFAIAYVQHLNWITQPVHEYKQPPIMSEIYLLREIIFMFFKPVTCFYFILQDGKITVRKNVSISSVSTDVLKKVLETEIVPVLNAMMQLRSIIKEHMTPKNIPDSATLEFFILSLMELIQPISQRLIDFEQQLLRKVDGEAGLPKNITLIGFLRHMHEQFEELQLLKALAEDVLIDGSPYLTSAYLLCRLYNLAKTCTPCQKTVMALLLVALTRYCVIIDNWLRYGTFDDFRDEFIVETGYKVNNIKCDTLRERLPLEIVANNEKAIKEIKECDLYQRLVEYAMQAFQSKALLRSVKLLDDLMNASKQLEPVHTDLINHLFRGLLARPDSNVSPSPSRRSCNNEEGTKRLRQQQHDKQLLDSVLGIGNTELMSLFTQHIQEAQSRNLQEKPLVPVTEMLERLDRCLRIQRPNVVSNAFHKALHPRCELTNVFIMRWYREEQLLDQHVKFLREILLQEADYLLQPFYFNLFIQIESGQDWAREKLLTFELFDTLESQYVERAKSIKVVHTSRMSAKSNKVYEALDGIELQYKFPKAITRIITVDHMLQYNIIWRLVLKIKWAAWKLNNMQFIRRTPSDIYAPLDLLGLTVRRLEMLRFWLIYAVNSLLSHFCTNVLHSISAKFEVDLKNCNDLDEICSLHNEYMKTIMVKCLLTDDFNDFRTALEQLFHLIFVLDMEWNSCSNYLHESHALSLHVSMDEDNSFENDISDLNISGRTRSMEYLALNQVDEIERTYIRCHQLLANILTNLVYRRNHKFLASLEVAFTSSVPY